MSLFINGDDFGMTESCSRAIAEALCGGMIDGATMAANGGYFEEAAALAKSLGFTDKIGVHLNLTEGRPLTDGMRSVTAFVCDGRFHKGYLSDPRRLDEREQAAVRAELSAQIDRVRSAGISALRADSHHYIHTFEYIAPLVAEVCREKGIVRLRINRTFDTPERPRITKGRIGNDFWRLMGFETTERFGRMSDIGSVPAEGDTEIMVHPDYDKDGALIDRTGVSDGAPRSGRVLRPKIKTVAMISDL